MLDIDFITANPDLVRRAIEVKGIDLDLDELLRAHADMKAALQDVESLRAERNRPSKQTGAAPHPWGDPPRFSFQPRDHVDLVEVNDWADLGRSGKIAGPRTFTLKGALVEVEMAIWRLAIDLLRDRGFTVVEVPSLVKEEALVGSGHFPRAAEDVYYPQKDNLYLSGTSEVSLNSPHSG